MIDKKALVRYLNREIVVAVNDKNIVGRLQEIFDHSILLYHEKWGETAVSISDIVNIRLKESELGLEKSE